jgi:hypothetical protein
MNKLIFITLLFVAFLTNAQTKKPGQTKAAKTPTVEPAPDTVVVEEVREDFPTEFKVYSKPAKPKKQRMKLCINLVSPDSILNYCVNDSLLNNPEVTKILFEQKEQDTTYTLVYVAAFTKDPNRPECAAGKEVKLFFLRWNTVRNKAVVRQKYIESCQKTVTRLTREPIEEWDGQTPLQVSYHRGDAFNTLTFDPKNYKLGLQTVNDMDGKKE